MTETTTETTETKRGSEGQTFLVGETLYLRGMQAEDAKRASAWRGSPFPIPAARAEEILKKEIPEQAEKRKFRLLACRIADDEPVGAVSYEHWDWRTAWLTVTADPALGADGMVAKAEMLRLVVPWMSDERHVMVVWAELEGGEPPVAAAAEALGMRPGYRLREAIWRDGARHEQVTYELIHPGWIERLGAPQAGDGVSSDRPAGGTSPPPRAEVVAPSTTPRNAVMVGERVYLRPMEVEDGEQTARWTRQETETFFGNGRWVGSPLLSGHYVRQMAENDPPSDIELAVVVRDGDELIGEVGLYGISWIHRTAETGSYLYRPQHRGGGLGTEAKHLLLGYAFDRLGLHMVRSFVWAPNTRSAAALRKQGYRDAGRLHWTSLRGGEFVDTLIFDLLAEEWQAGRRQSADGSR